MSYKFPPIIRATPGFFRSSVVVAVAGATSGFSVICTAVNNSNLELRAAIATVVSSAVVALADWIVHQRRLRKHEDNVTVEHEKTRALIRGKPRPKSLQFRKGGK